MSALAQFAYSSRTSREVREVPLPDFVSISLYLDVGGLDDRPPLIDLGFMKGAKSLRRLLIQRCNFLPQIGEPLTHCRVGQTFSHGSVEPHDDVLRGAFWNPDTCPK